VLWVVVVVLYVHGHEEEECGDVVAETMMRVNFEDEVEPEWDLVEVLRSEDEEKVFLEERPGPSVVWTSEVDENAELVRKFADFGIAFAMRIDLKGKRVKVVRRDGEEIEVPERMNLERAIWKFAHPKIAEIDYESEDFFIQEGLPVIVVFDNEEIVDKIASQFQDGKWRLAVARKELSLAELRYFSSEYFECTPYDSVCAGLRKPNGKYFKIVNPDNLQMKEIQLEEEKLAAAKTGPHG